MWRRQKLKPKPQIGSSSIFLLEFVRKNLNKIKYYSQPESKPAGLLSQHGPKL